MTPLLFPHTCLAPELAAAAANWFPHLAVYQPAGDRLPEELTPWIAGGFLDVRIPVPDEAERVVAAVGEYQRWAFENKGGRDLKTALPPGPAVIRPPFFEETAPSQILADLKGGSRRDAGEAARLFRARMFLCLAQELDRQSLELRRRLNGVAVDSRALMAGLQPEPDREKVGLLGTFGDAGEDFYEYMLAERLNAWAQLCFQDELAGAVLLTFSRRMLADILAGCENAELLEHTEAADLPDAAQVAASPPGDRLLNKLTELCRQPRTDPSAGLASLPPSPARSAAATLDLYLIPDRSLEDLLTSWTGGRVPARSRTAGGVKASRHVVIGGVHLCNPLK